MELAKLTNKFVTLHVIVIQKTENIGYPTATGGISIVREVGHDGLRYEYRLIPIKKNLELK